jgi:hypothetical protein
VEVEGVEPQHRGGETTASTRVSVKTKVVPRRFV